MTLVERLFAAAPQAAKFLRDSREPMQFFDHDSGSIKGWTVCTPEFYTGVGWVTRTDILLSGDGALYSLYTRSVSRADIEARKPCRTLTHLKEDSPWPDLHKRAVLKKLQEMRP
jgi:hypothetical protein